MITLFASFYAFEPFMVPTGLDAGSVSPVRLVFSTASERVSGVSLQLSASTFKVSETCEDVIDAWGGVPSLDCEFSLNSVIFRFSRNLSPFLVYSLNFLLTQPSSLKENTFRLSTLDARNNVIEVSANPGVVAAWTFQRDIAAQLLDLKIISQSSSEPSSSNSIVFSISWTGQFDQTHAIDVLALPPDTWNLGVPGTVCPGYDQVGLGSGTLCKFQTYNGGIPGNSNGFKITIGDTPLSGGSKQFMVTVTNPSRGGNSVWVARSINSLFLSSSVVSDSSVSVSGTPTGRIVNASFPVANQIQAVTLSIVPGNTLLRKGTITIIPFSGFTVVSSLGDPRPVVGENFLEGKWTTDLVNNRWILTTSGSPVFPDTVYLVTVFVQNPSVPQPAFSWTLLLASESGSDISSTRNIRGTSIFGSLDCAIAPSSLRSGAVQSIAFSVTYSQSVAGPSSLRVTAPIGFRVIVPIKHFQMISGPGPTVLVEKSLNQLVLNFAVGTIIEAASTLIFSAEVLNPQIDQIAIPPQKWLLETRMFDESIVDWGAAESFSIFENEFKQIQILPISRLAGSQLIVVQFSPFVPILTNDFIRLIAPPGFVWDSEGFFSTNHSATNITSFYAELFSTTNSNELEMLVTGSSLLPGILFGISAKVVVPFSSPIFGNAWTMQHYRLLGRGEIRRLASSTAVGFQTQSILDIRVIPYDRAASSWNNFILVLFTTTSDVPSGGSLEISAPLGYTLICPPRPFQGKESFAISPPLDISIRRFLSANSCSAKQGMKNEAKFVLSQPLAENSKYMYVMSVINAGAVSESSNKFTLTSFSPSGSLIETGSVAGFSLCQQMVDSVLIGATDRRAGVYNQATFAVPIITNSNLIIKAPIGAVLCPNGPQTSCTILPTTYLGSQYMSFPPSSASCTCTSSASEASISFTAPLTAGLYGITLGLVNPVSTPVWNYWRFFLNDPSSGGTDQSAVWVEGFKIQEIFNVSITSLNPANAVSGQMAVNPIELVFVTSTKIEGGGKIEVGLPVGFAAPLDACSLFPTTVERIPPLPSKTTCSGDSASSIHIRIPDNSHVLPGRYGIRFYVNNPESPSQIAGNWSITSTSSNGVLIDMASNVPGFVVKQRLRFFAVTPFSRAGSTNTSVEIILSLSANLSPQKSIIVSAPAGFVFWNVNSACSSPEDVSIVFAQSGLGRILPLPSFVTCTISSPSSALLINTDPIRHGRSLVNSTYFSFIIANILNPVSTPYMNMWSISADTTWPQMWTSPGYTIQPKLTSVSVTSSNPGFGLFTYFTFSFKAVTSIDPGGSVTVTAPNSGYMFDLSCRVVSASPAGCPFAFAPCMSGNTILCSQYTSLCIEKDFSFSSLLTGASPILFCSGSAGSLRIQTGSDVSIPGGAQLAFTVAGFNSYSGGGKWVIETRNTRPLDRAVVSSFDLFGVVHNVSVNPSTQKVSSSNNQVEISFILSTFLLPPSRIDVSFPTAFSQNIDMVIAVKLGGTFPLVFQWHLVGTNTVRIECPNDVIPSGDILRIFLTVSNPSITPSDSENLWTINAYSGKNLKNVNNRISGFPVFAEFQSVAVVGTVLGPNSVNTVGISITLGSNLFCDIDRPNSFLEIRFPQGFAPVDSVCGSALFSTFYSRYDGADSSFATDLSLIAIPAGSICSSIMVNNSLIVSVLLDSDLRMGIPYAFQLGIINPSTTPVDIYLSFTTSVNGVILHRQDGVPGQSMRLLDRFVTVPSISSKSAQNVLISFVIRSVKTIPASSKFAISAPLGFHFACNLSGLLTITSATVCVSNGNILTLTIDKTLTIVPNTEIRFSVTVSNPASTPQKNIWSIKIVNSAGTTVDVDPGVPGFDVTGGISGSVSAPSTYVNQKSLVTVSFAPSTVQTRAVSGNSIVLVAPSGYIFKPQCEGLSLRAVSSNLANYPVPASHMFPLSSLTCAGHGNETVSILFSRGIALHMFNYELTIMVVNANVSSAGNQWTLFTLGPNLVTSTIHTLDYNSSIPGYALANQTTSG